jgi:ATP-dependent protease Clp ATPase subunit
MVPIESKKGKRFVDTTKILFICAGAFNNEDIASDIQKSAEQLNRHGFNNELIGSSSFML